MVMININDKFRVVSDQYCYTLQRFKGVIQEGPRKSETMWESLSHYDTLSGCLTDYVSHQAKVKEAKTLAEWVKNVQDAEGEIKEILSCLPKK